MNQTQRRQELKATQEECAYGDALTAVASGATRDATLTFLSRSYSAVDAETITRISKEAYRDARKQGVERDDIDPSWYR